MRFGAVIKHKKGFLNTGTAIPRVDVITGQLPSECLPGDKVHSVEMLDEGRIMLQRHTI